MYKLKNLKHIFVIIGITLLFVLSMTIFLQSAFFDSINNFFIYRTGVPSSALQDVIHRHALKSSVDKIAIIDIDDATLNALQAKGNLKMLRIPKSVYIDVVEKLEAAGVLGIGFDIIFENMDPDEEEFARTLKRYDNIVIAAESKDASFYEDHPCVDDGSGSYTTCPGVPRSVYGAVPWGIVNNITSSYMLAEGDISGLPYLAWKIASSSHFSLDNITLKPLGYTLFELAGNTIQDYPSFYFSDTTGQQKKVVLNSYFGPPGSYHRISLKDILEMSRLDLRTSFSGRYVLIGESGTAIHDSTISPVTGEGMDGVELHANLIDGLLQNKMLHRISNAVIVPILIFLILLLSFVYFFIPKYLSPIIAIVSVVAIIWVSRYMYDKQRVLIDIFPLFLSGILPYIVTYIYRFFIVDREKRELQANFGHYVDPIVVKKIAEQSEPIELGGEKRELSILFSDIAGFTTLSEQLIPQDLFYLMTSYLSNMTDILIHEGGTLDKYIGDAVMGFFGAPLPLADHAVRACRTAILMRERLPAFNTDIVAHGLEPIDFRVGIATGEVMVGNIGSHDRFNYTVLGDTVNLASRLEGTGKEYGVNIIISESVREKLNTDFVVREIDTIAVKGKNEGVRIYELIGFAKKVSDVVLYDDYEKALSWYRDGRYREAGEIWANLMEKDPPSKVMALRCAAIINREMTVENGIYRMTHK